MAEKARQLRESFDVKALRDHCAIDRQADCDKLAATSIYLQQQETLGDLQNRNATFERVKGSEEGLFSYVQRLKKNNPQLINFSFEDFSLHYSSEYQTFKTQPIPDPLNIYEGQVIWVELGADQQPMVHVHGLETTPEFSRPYRVLPETTWEDIVTRFGMNDVPLSVREVGTLDAAPKAFDAAPALEYGMEVEREGNRLVISKLPNITYNEQQKAKLTKQLTWYSVTTLGLGMSWSDVEKKADAGDIFISTDGGKTRSVFDYTKISPSENTWFIGDTFYIGSVKTTTTNIDPSGWREISESFGIDHTRSYPYIKIQKEGDSSYYYMEELNKLGAESGQDHPLWSGNIDLKFDPQARTIYWNQSKSEVSVLPPKEPKVEPKKSTRAVPFPIPKPPRKYPAELPTPDQKTFEHVAIYPSDVKVLSYVMAHFDVAPSSLNSSNIKQVLVDSISKLTAEDYIDFRREFGAKRTLISFFSRYGLDKVDRKPQLLVAVNSVVDAIKPGTKQAVVMEAFGGALSFKDILMKLSFHETAGRLNHKSIGEIRGFNFSGTACQGFFQLNWSNTKAFNVNPFNAVESTKAIIELMVENSGYFDRPPLRTKASRSNYLAKRKKDKTTRADYILAAHNGGWKAAYTRKKGGGKENKNPEPYDFVKKIKAVHDYSGEFKNDSVLDKMASLMFAK